MVQLDLLEDELLVFGNFEAEKFEIEVKVTDWLPSWLIVLEVESLHVRMREGLLDSNTALRVKSQHLLNEVNRVLVGPSEQLIEVFAAIVG